jgi:hypothetical protein
MSFKFELHAAGWLSKQQQAISGKRANVCFESRPMTMQRVIRICGHEFIPVTNLGRLDICKFPLAFSAGRLLFNSVKKKYIM